jgi:hypothetical protein
MSARNSPVWPIVLIVLGLAFLGSNLGLISFGELRQLLAVWWPLILIGVGIAGLLRRGP